MKLLTRVKPAALSPSTEAMPDVNPTQYRLVLHGEKTCIGLDFLLKSNLWTILTCYKPRRVETAQ